MPFPGTVWAPNTWGVNAWAADTWADATTPVVITPPIRAEMSVSSRPASMTRTSRTPTLVQSDA